MRVEYALTPLGGSLVEPLAALRDWAEANIGEILESRAAATNRPPADD